MTLKTHAMSYVYKGKKDVAFTFFTRPLLSSHVGPNKALKSSHVSSSSCVLNKKKKKGGKNDLWLFVECNDNNTFFVMKFAALHFIFKEIGIKNWSIYVYPMTHIFPSSRVLELKWTISTLKKKSSIQKRRITNRVLVNCFLNFFFLLAGWKKSIVGKKSVGSSKVKSLLIEEHDLK